jgi:hypothetical protein
MLLGLAAGIAAGYSVSRVIEARAVGLPLVEAFKLDPQTLLTSVSVLAAARAKNKVFSAAVNANLAPAVIDVDVTPA